MGLDLQLLPNDSDSPDRVPYSHTVLNCTRREDLFDAISKIEEEHGEEVPEYFPTYVCRNDEEYEETHYGNTQETPYGDKLLLVKVKHIKRLASHQGVIDNWKNRAIWAYLEQMPDTLDVALMWD
jgi:hypothetical protein